MVAHIRYHGSARTSACLVDILSWMTAHQLKLTPSKTDLLVIPSDPAPAQDLVLSLNNSMISPSGTARNLEKDSAISIHTGYSEVVERTSPRCPTAESLTVFKRQLKTYLFLKHLN
ncbi:hypothetical protein QTP86_015972 [Hemibagrus guttatus]|nr:hypothetical protein QTP86_015972 [Hemibagrus guttatus]